MCVCGCVEMEESRRLRSRGCRMMVSRGCAEMAERELRARDHDVVWGVRARETRL